MHSRVLLSRADVSSLYQVLGSAATMISATAKQDIQEGQIVAELSGLLVESRANDTALNLVQALQQFKRTRRNNKVAVPSHAVFLSIAV